MSETEEQLIARFVGGLKGKLQEKLTLQPQQTLMDTMRVSEQLERWTARRYNFTPGASTSRAPQANDKGLLPTPKDKNKAGDTGTDNQGNKYNNYDPSMSNIKCYRCGEMGHKCNVCLNSQTLRD